MTVNRLRSLWAEDRAAVNGWCALPDAFATELMARAGWDTLTIDLQHGLGDARTLVPMLQAISTTPVVPVVRVPWLEPGILMRALDAGAQALICPMVNTREDAERLVAYTHYAPQGTRSFGPIRAGVVGGPDYFARANAEIVVFAMIETAEALENLDAIVSTPGLDAVYVGPSDLSISLGHPPGFDGLAAPVEAAIARVLDGARAHGVTAGIHCGSAEGAKRRIAQGFRFVSIGSDAVFVREGARAIVQAMREG